MLLRHKVFNNLFLTICYSRSNVHPSKYYDGRGDATLSGHEEIYLPPGDTISTCKYATRGHYINISARHQRRLYPHINISLDGHYSHVNIPPGSIIYTGKNIFTINMMIRLTVELTHLGGYYQMSTVQYNDGMIYLFNTKKPLTYI